MFMASVGVRVGLHMDSGVHRLTVRYMYIPHDCVRHGLLSRSDSGKHPDGASHAEVSLAVVA